AAHPEKILATLDGHTNDVHGIAINATGSALVSAGDDQTVRIWDVAARRPNRILSGHERQIPAVAFDPPGSRVATAGRDHTIRIWDSFIGDVPNILRGHSND